MSNLNTVSTLQDLVDHAGGLSRRHEADSVDLTSPIVIDGYTVTNLEEAIQKLSEMALPPTIPDATEFDKGVIRLSGDLGGTASLPAVNRIRGMQISTDIPVDGNVLTWLDNEWKPLEPSTVVPNASVNIFGKVRLSDGVTTAGDIGGSAGNLSIIKLQDYNLSLGGSNPVYSNQFIKWDGYSWVNSYLPEADGYNFGTVRLAGDVELLSSSGQLKVTGLQSYPVELPCQPYDGDVLTWVSPDGYWTSKSIATATSTDFGAIKLTSDFGGTASQPEVVGWRYKPLGSEFSSPQKYDIPIYNSPSTTFGFDIDPGPEQWTLINLQEIVDGVTFTATGDLEGSNSSQKVVGLYNVPIDSTAMEPVVGDVLMYQEVLVPAFDLGSTVGKWVPTQLDPADFFTAGGDLSGTNSSQTVTGLRGKELSSQFSSPTDGDVPLYSASEGSWILTNLYSILDPIINNTYDPYNPEIKEYTQNNVKNKYFKYQGSVQSVNLVRETFIDYAVDDQSSLIISGKIIARVIQNNEPPIIVLPASTFSGSGDDGYVDLTPSEPSIGRLGFDLDSSVYEGYTVIYDIEASYVKNDGYIAAMFTTNKNLYSVDYGTGVVDNIIAPISDYPAGIYAAFYPPVIQFIDNNTVQIASGYADNATINWTIDLEIRENKI